jgi:hypothetical protein
MSQNSSHSGRLPWVEGSFPAKKTGEFEYMIARGEGKLLINARENAFDSFLTDLGNNAGVTVDSRTISEIKSNMNYSGNGSTYEGAQHFMSTINIERGNFKASFSKVGEYYEYENGVYHLWELYEVSPRGNSFKPIIPEYTDHYGLSAGWKSALLPGWGQFYKGKTVKGAVFLSAEILAVSGLVYSEMRRSDNIRLSQETTSISIIKEYRDRADTWALRRNIAIGATAGIYVWNVLDAALSKGKMRYAWIPDNLHLNGSQESGNHYIGLTYDF